jgi:hypothetical protein
MKWRFIHPDFIPIHLYFCNHEGKGFTVSTDARLAMTVKDPDEIKWRVQRIILQSGFKPEVVKVR